MRCKRCDYRLWNLAGRRCPECGMPFRPSEFDFAPNAVEFCCPHCAQMYFGTGARGHLVPAAFECVRCRQPVSMDEMLLRPAGDVDERDTMAAVAPWIDPRRRGWFGRIGAWLKSVGMALVQPGRFMELLPHSSGLRPAWVFALLTLAIVAFCAAANLVLLFYVTAGPFRRGPDLLDVVGSAIAAYFIVVTALVVAIPVVHGLLCITGRTVGGIGRTAQSLCYSAGATAVVVVPCLGVYLGWIWWLVSAVHMVRAGQRTSGLRASLAVLAGPALVLLLYFFAELSYYNTATTLAPLPAPVAVMPTSAPAPRMSAAYEAGAALSLYAYEVGQGFGPRHALELVAEGRLEMRNLILKESATRQRDIPIGTITGADFGALPPEEQRRIAGEMADALPEDVVAYRVGDLVFTYCGLEMVADVHRDMWIVLSSPDPDCNEDAEERRIFTTSVTGITRSYSKSELRVILEVQNRIRTGRKLAPLPEPWKITHAAPALKPPPSTQPRPAPIPARRLTTQPATQPSTQPATQPATQPSTQPATQPAQPAMRAAPEPTSSEQDPP